MSTIKNNRKILSLHRETLRTLQNDEIVIVVGGQCQTETCNGSLCQSCLTSGGPACCKGA